MGAKSSKLEQPTAVVPEATTKDPLDIEAVVVPHDDDDDDRADADGKPSLQPQAPQATQALQEPQATETKGLQGLQELSTMQRALKYADKILYEYINAATNRYLLNKEDPSRYNQYKYDIVRHTDYCIEAAREILQNVTSSTKYRTCKKPPFYIFFNKPKPAEHEYDACIAMKKIAERIVQEENKILNAANSDSSTPHTLYTLVDINAVLLRIFKHFVDDDATCSSFILDITGRDVSKYLNKQPKQPQQGSGGGGKKSRSMRRAHATSIRQHRRNSRIHHHSVSHRNKCIRTHRHKRTVRRSHYQRK